MTGNIIGEPFEGFVQEQIGIRQFSQFGGYDSLRNDVQLQYLSNRNAWVKFASSIKISDNNAGRKKLDKLGIESLDSFFGTKLAESAILFNTLSSYSDSKSPLSSKRAGITDETTVNLYGNSAATLWNNSFAYGIGARDFGLQPPPGIIAVTVDSLNRGSIRKANVTLKAHNRFQFDIIELLYLRLGYTMMLEWGWDKYIEFINSASDELVISNVGNTIIEENWFTSNGISQIGMVNLIKEYQNRYSGNYDGFFGKVSNFTWNFNPDGTYDISIDLITIGDVIESLKVNTSSKFLGLPNGTAPPEPTTTTTTPAEPQEEANNITKAAYINTVGYFLYLKAYEISAGFNIKNLASRATTAGSIINDGVNNYYIINPSKTRPDINTTAKGNQSTQFYIRLKEFFSQLERLVIPQIDGDLQLQFELDSCYISHFPNQISFDPKVCIFKFPLDYGDIPTTTTGDYEGVLNPTLSGDDSNYLQYLADFPVKSGNYTYGDLMNIYVNFEFISGLLLANGGPDQTITLFKFLQDLCNGINSALGGVNKLEPIIKNDYIVTIIDQTFSSASSRNNVNLEVYGYNTELQTSNFVKDIKFVSKITPQLASMITIGATAAGSSTSEIDGTAFSKWSEGLVDRFSTEISEPSGLSTLESQQALQQQQQTEQHYKDIWLAFPTSGNVTGTRIQNKLGAVSRIIGAFFAGGGSMGGGVGTVINVAPIITRQEQIESQRLDQIETRIIGKPYQKFLNQSMTFQEFYPKALAYDAWLKDNKVYTPESIQDQVSSNYLIYLLNAFGGITSEYKIPYPNNRLKTTLVANFKIPSQNSRYLEFNDSFIAQGKSAYQNYLNTLNSNRFRDRNIPSNEAGFIPLSFEVTLDGISGIKIYNKLDINNSFLPSNYPESLKFIITKVNHNISNNSWDTLLSTISIPETSEYKFGEFTTPPKPIPVSQGGGDLGNGDSSLPRVVDGVTQVSLTTGISLVNPSLSAAYPNKVIYVPQETKKTQIYLHHTAGQGTARQVIRGTWATSKFTYPIGTHYIIEANGHTEYVFDEKYWSHHLAKGKLERSSISVELMSYGTLKLKDGKYYAWPAKYSNTVIAADQVTQPVGKDGKIIRYRGYDYFQRYTDAQIKALETLFNQWKQKYPDINWKFNYDEMFPPTGVTSSIAESGASGVYSHNSVRTDKIDIFPQKELIDMLKRVLK
jgi:hypothetical protein